MADDPKTSPETKDSEKEFIKNKIGDLNKNTEDTENNNNEEIEKLEKRLDEIDSEE
jgi:hypothetical protein